MVPAWLHGLSWGFLALGALCALVIAADELKRPQHMWIMNVVWPITALFGTIWIVWQYFTYGRSPARAEAHAHSEMKKKPLPFPIAVANATLHCGAGCTLGDILAECFFKTEDETEDELRHMGYHRLLTVYPTAHVAAGVVLDRAELEELFLEGGR